MQLWTEYEGVTIDGAYPLQKLLLPEGRSAFYSTTGPNGELKVVRLIECHFDEEDILARWRSVEALNHPNFLKFEHFGQTDIDGRPVVYAVLEKVDANLAEVLDRGTLSSDDVAQLGLSLVAALDVLHTHGFIHEHVEPRNVFALNDTVKLRSDCIREAPEGEAGRAAKQRDVSDLANVLLRGITQRGSVEGLPDSLLPKPFNQIIRKGLDGTWGLENIRAALEDYSASKQPVEPALNGLSPAPAAAAKTSMPPEASLPLPLLNEELNMRSVRANPREVARTEGKGFSLSPRWLGIVGMVSLLVIGFLWVHGRAGEAKRLEGSKAEAVSKPAVQEPARSAAQPNGQISNVLTPKPSAQGVGLNAMAGHSAGWRVIAYTYNRKPDAEKKVSSIAQSHPELKPVVFTSSGHSPYLVSIGGVMDQQAAYALARRSRSLGLPHDMYAQNYNR
ncbi:hypothetical protein HDF16_002743 [Granulicella aggregans]|uniref:Protein kinase domain-containing protein n=1 Tax=Granulicella aggregans TaxID=474949 RepID=A0A7W8E3X6_9BACT|nr:SPOR domain-containing protein [Granulicella aggregans]MBB5058037.1 hypothetical protein [Granulicella aggregans]